MLDQYHQEIARTPRAHAVYHPLANPLDTLLRDILDSTLLYENDDHILGYLEVHELLNQSDTLWPGKGVISLQWAERRHVVTSVWRQHMDVELPVELACLQIGEEFDELRHYDAAELAPPAFTSAPLNHTSTSRSASISKAMQTLLKSLQAQGYIATPGVDHSAFYVTYCLRKTNHPTVLMGFYLEQINAF